MRRKRHYLAEGEEKRAKTVRRFFLLFTVTFLGGYDERGRKSRLMLY